MLEPRPISPATNHEELFIQRYQWLMNWALRMTGQDRAQAQDLVHDTFVQFVISRPPLEAIQQNLEGYLYTMLRNMHVSQARRAARIREATFSLSRILSLSETASVQSELTKVEQSTLTQVQDELCRICQYAILRKDSSKVGSVVLLRFFHGYYPAEIAQVLRTSRSGVDKLLLRARSEATSYLNDPNSLNFIKQGKVNAVPQIRFGQPAEDLLRELREAIYLARDGDCLGAEDLADLYRSAEPSEETGKLDHRLLSHIVSCATCLDEVNKQLGLPLLAGRHAAAMTGKESRKRDKGDGGDGGGEGSGASGDDLMSQTRGRLKDVLNHRPHELRVSVNGFILGSQTINSALSELSITAKGEEKIGFVEVFSEREVRLLFSVVEPPPDGPVELRRRAELSDGRTLELLVDFSESWPAVHVVYSDPTFHAETDVKASRVENDDSVVQRLPRAGTSLGQRIRGWFDARHWRPDWGLLLRPATVTTVFALVLIAVLLLVFLRPTSITTVSAAELIRQSVANEQTQAARTDQVVHRTINLEELSSTGAVIARRRVEVWHSAERGLTARRLYDERGTLLAGDWRRRDEVQTLYQHGTRPRLQLTPDKRDRLPLVLENVWQLELSAKEFASLVGNTDTARVEEKPGAYVINYANTESDENKLIKATLTLTRSDLHAIEETLLVKKGDGIREYRFTESSFERRSPTTVAPKVFEPEPELLSSVEPTPRVSKTEATNPNAGPQPLAPVPATAELEVEALSLLHQAGADLGEQVTVTRTSEGQLRIQGLVESDKRKTELLSALASLKSNPAVRVEIQTVAEAVAGTSRKTQSGPTSVSVETVETSNNVFPAYADLRARFSDEEARAFAIRMVKRSHNAMRHAWALKRLLNQFSAEDLRGLNAEARAKWLSLIRAHAIAFEQETRSLRQELQPVFFPSLSRGEAPSVGEISDDASLARAVERLFETGNANDRAISSAFAISTQGGGSVTVRSPEFFQSLLSTESLAQEIASIKQ